MCGVDRQYQALNMVLNTLNHKPQILVAQRDARLQKFIRLIILLLQIEDSQTLYEY